MIGRGAARFACMASWIRGTSTGKKTVGFVVSPTPEATRCATTPCTPSVPPVFFVYRPISVRSRSDATASSIVSSGPRARRLRGGVWMCLSSRSASSVSLHSLRPFLSGTGGRVGLTQQLPLPLPSPSPAPRAWLRPTWPARLPRRCTPVHSVYRSSISGAPTEEQSAAAV